MLYIITAVDYGRLGVAGVQTPRAPIYDSLKSPLGGLTRHPTVASAQSAGLLSTIEVNAKVWPVIVGDRLISFATRGRFLDSLTSLQNTSLRESTMVCAGATSVTVVSFEDAATGCCTLHAGDGEVQFLLESVGAVSAGEKLSSLLCHAPLSWIKEINAILCFTDFMNFAVETTHKAIGIV